VNAPEGASAPYLVLVQIETALDADDPAAWAVIPARSEEDIEELWDAHDGRNFGTEVVGVYRWDPECPCVSEDRPGGYVPHPAWTRPRPEAREENP